MINPRQVPIAHEDVFVERYDHLLGWSLHLAENDRELAEDLIHDLFIQFVVNEPDLQKISNLDGYLYTMLRNLHLAQRRRDTRNRLQQFSIVEYDSAEIGLRTTDPRDQIQAQDDLRRVCQYACTRKESTKAASVLILRFFHGYYPEEIVRILRSPRSLADQLLRLARNEAKANLGATEQLAFINEAPVPQVLPTGYARSLDSFLEELRLTIFQAKHGSCLTSKDLKRVYSSESANPVQCAELSHLVSCAPCLDRVNALLGLPLLAERSATEMLGRDTRKHGGGGGPSGAGGGGLSNLTLNKLRRKVKDTLVHKPQELCVSVNGNTLGSHRVGAERSELNLIVDREERVSFIEVFSEQKIRLLMMGVDELPPDGPGERVSQVKLSDRRSLEVRLRFASPSPTIQVVYVDPHFNEALAIAAFDANAISSSTRDKQIDPPDSIAAADQASLKTTESINLARSPNSIYGAGGIRKPIRSRLAGLGRWTFNFGLFLRPSTVTALAALILIAAAIILHRGIPTPPLSASELLTKAAAAEAAVAATTDQVLHRTINIEEKSLSGELLARHRVEVWQSAQRGITARRLYDERGSLVAGDWRRSDGVQTLYHHGSRPQLQLSPEKRNLTSITFDNAWQLSPSAREFRALLAETQAAHFEEKGLSFVISYERPVSGARAQGLIKASLILSKSDLHATELTLTIAADDPQHGAEQRSNQNQNANRQSAIGNRQWRQYRFFETSFERRPLSTVAPAVFDPEVELLGETVTRRRENSEMSGLPVPAPAVATAAVEVEVLKLLSAAGADMGEQVNVTRTPEGHLRVEGLIETAERKAELLSVLHAVRNNPAVQIRIQTVSEALSKQKPAVQSASTPIAVESTTIGDSIPAHAELRRYFTARGETDDQVEQNVRRFATRMTSLSYVTVQRAMALKRLAGRFSPEELRTMDVETRAEWLALIRSHARTLQQQVVALNQELKLIFPPAPSVGAYEEAEIRSDADLMEVADRLFAFCSSYDESIHRALTVSPDTSGASEIKGPQFWRALQSAENLSAKISQFR